MPMPPEKLEEMRRLVEQLGAELERYAEGAAPAERSSLRMIEAHAFALADELQRLIVRRSLEKAPAAAPEEKPALVA
jgi:hypothetical protein